LAADWDEGFAGHWDDAVKGSSSLASGLLRSLLDELAVASGMDACAIYLDLAKFYDNISLVKLIALAFKAGYPALPLALSLQAYLGPRFSRSEGCVSRPILPTGSVGAGCKRANQLSRVLLFDVLSFMHQKHPMVSCRSFVDDMVARCEGTSRLVLRWLGAAAKDLVKLLENTDLVVSYDKTIIGGTSAGLVLQMQQALAKEGIKFKISLNKEVKGLGVGQGGGRKRSCRTWKGRLLKACGRARRALKLKVTGAARKLIATGAIPAAAYGASCGIAPTSIHKLRLLAARATVGAGTACCLTTALAFDGKPFADPGVRLRCEAILTWIRTLRKMPTARSASLEAVWQRTLHTFAGLEGKSLWRTVRGPLGATIAALLEAGWSPGEPLCWKDELGDTWDMYDDEFGLGELKARLAEAFQAGYWRKATSSRHCADLGGGVDFTVIRKVLRQMTNAKQHTQHNVLMSIATGSSWTAERLATAGKMGPPVCYRCGAAGLTDWHAFLECPTFADSKNRQLAAFGPLHGLPQRMVGGKFLAQGFGKEQPH
jgi:hypothetical protein